MKSGKKYDYTSFSAGFFLVFFGFMIKPLIAGDICGSEKDTSNFRELQTTYWGESIDWCYPSGKIDSFQAQYTRTKRQFRKIIDKESGQFVWETISVREEPTGKYKVLNLD